MTLNEFIENYINNGLKPVVVFDTNDINDFISYIQKNMMGRIVDIIHDGDDVYKLFIDLKEFEENNKLFDSPVWYDRNGEPSLTGIEAGMYPKDGIETLYLDGGFDVPFRVKDQNPLLDEYNDEKPDVTYIEWLENKVMELQK